MLLQLLKGARCLQAIVAFILIMINIVPAIECTSCAPSQMAELGKQGIINCNFSEDFYAVYWYDDLADGISPVIIFKPQSTGKSGPGFLNETYDVFRNGSLLISSVTAWSERRYKVILENNQRSFETYFTYLKVIAYPKGDFPTAKCDDCSIGYHHIKANETLACSFNEARPPVHVQWFERFPNEDILLDQQMIDVIDNKDGTYNSSTTVRLMANGEIANLISVLVCRATWNATDWREEKQMLIDFSNADSFLNVISSMLHVEINRRAEVQCEGSSESSKIWRKIPIRGEPETVGFSSGGWTQVTAKFPNMDISAEGSLVFSHPQIQDEGSYACLYNDGKHPTGMKITDLNVLIPPSPPFIEIKGCDDALRPCEFQEKDLHELTCSVYGVYPNVSLKWIARDKRQISFFNSKRISQKRGTTFDVLYSTEYKVSEDIVCEEYIPVECQIFGPISRIIKAEARALIIPKFCNKGTMTGNSSLDSVSVILIMWNSLISFALASISFSVIYLWRKINDTSRTEFSSSTTPLTGTSDERIQDYHEMSQST